MSATPKKAETSPAKQALIDSFRNLMDSAKAFVKDEALNAVDGALAAVDEGKKKPKKDE